MRAPATKSQLAAAYIRPYRDGQVIDEYTFQANLNAPYAAFLSVLAQSWLSMESPKAIQDIHRGSFNHRRDRGPLCSRNMFGRKAQPS